ncbi:hypothetical protein, conserved [Babesia ovata]|uniref:C3H1-type domain-containing protein n=1 Tax=Babesia ovata TaxID=189622 RepID=A0A2H6KJI2_9APIC|nr:uncharacterized protein BOVATA_046340 [Babesia ovata]GBE63141.1 hypothetical protein, conserved [Babesia ovata]
MSFLHGVLESVKEDDAVKTYDNNDINNVISSLKTNVGQGRQAFQAAVDKVDHKTTDVFMEFSKFGHTSIVEKINYIAGAQGMKLQDQLTSWRSTLTGLDAQLESLITHNVNVLDPVLRDKLMHKIEPVKSAVQVLKGSADSKELEGQVKTVDYTLHVQFSAIYNALYELTKVRNAHFNTITDSLNASRELVEKELHKSTGTTTVQILSMFEEIKMATSNVYHSLMGKKVDIERLVTQAQEAFGTLKESVGQNTANEKTGVIGNWDKLKEDIRNFVFHHIYGQNATDGIKGIVSGIGTYASGFSGKTAFGRLIGEWVNEIVDKEPMKGYITAYVTKNNDEKKFSGNLSGGSVDDMVSHMNSILKDKVADALKQIKPKTLLGTNSTVDGDLQDVIDFLTQFFSKVITQESTIITAVEEKLGEDEHLSMTTPSTSPHKPYLVDAVKATLTAVASTTKQLSAQLQKFKITSKIANLTQVRQRVGEIPGKLYDDSSLGQQITNALLVVKNKIELLTPILQNTGGTLKAKVEEIQNEVINDLNDITIKEQSTINSKKQSAKEKMEELKNKIENKLKDINGAVVDANTLLKNAIDGVETVVKTAQDTIKQAIQKLFAEQHVADLSALHTLVEQKLAEVRKIIDEDKVTGVKGFFGKMEKYFVKKINDFFPKLLELQQPADDPSQKKTLADLSETVNKAYGFFFHHLQQQTDFVSDFEKIKPSATALHTLLEKLVTSQHFDYKFRDNLDKLKIQLEALIPHTFGEGQAPAILEALRTGFHPLVKELGKAYVSRYSGLKLRQLVDDKDSGSPEKGKITVLNEDGINCAKTCLTSLKILQDELSSLREMCEKDATRGGWKMLTLTQKDGNRSNPLGAFFKNSGYNVPQNQDTQDGELRNKKECHGNYILDSLLNSTLKTTDQTSKHLKVCESNKVKGKDKPKKDDNFNLSDLLSCLHSHLVEYYSVGHIAKFASKRHPCSIFEMLTWLTGLPHNSVYKPTTDHITTLFLVDDEANPTKKKNVPIDAYPSSFTDKNVHHALQQITSYSHLILTRILGTGDAHTIYASDFSNNHLGLHYPKRGEDCLNMILDILRRVFPPLRFLESRCNIRTSDNGWRNCQYGRDVSFAKSHCNEHPSDESDCRPRSPLMSYLSDSLPGHLPHHLTQIGCRSSCSTCTKATPGMPCLTPLGFRGFSGSTRLGKELGNVLSKMFDESHISCIMSLSPKPPATIAEHFGFALSIVMGINVPKTRASEKAKLLQTPFVDAIESSITKQSISLYSPATELTDAVNKVYGMSQKDHSTTYPGPEFTELCSLSRNNISASKDVHCAPYVSTLCTDTYNYLPNKHSNLYLSWMLYLPWDFHEYLKNLYDAFCNIVCQDWGCRSCLHGEKCKRGQHGLTDEKTTAPHCRCISISLNDKIDLLKNSAKSTGNSQNDSKINDLKSQLKDHIAKYHSLSESDRTSQLKDIHSRMVSLAELSGKLGQFIGQSDVITKAIENAITTIIDSNDDFKSLLNSQSPTPQSSTSVPAVSIDTDKFDEKIKRYEEQIKLLKPKIEEHKTQKTSVPDDLNKSHESCQSKLDALQKLKSLNESFESLKSPQDKPCETLLNNLCSGLEKFLGYQETSKGYDGSGIVYSDLDRLCDGVMSFLHGVLESVKDDDNVTTYDKDNDFKNLPSSISKLMHKGSHGFSQAIAQVSDALGAWSGELERKTSTVVHLFTNLRAINFVALKKSLSALNELRHDELGQVAEKLQTCFRDASQLRTAYNMAKQQYGLLDKSLISKLHDPVSKTEMEVKLFFEAATNKELRDVLRLSEEQLTELENNVKYKIEYHVRVMQGEINQDFNDQIKNPITEVDKKLKEVKGRLGKWMLEAHSVLDTAVGKASEIWKGLEPMGRESTGTNISKITEANSEISKVHETLSRIEGSLNFWIKGAEGTVQSALSKVEAILTEIGERSKNKMDVISAIQSLKTQTATHFLNLKSEELKAITQQAGEHLKELASSVEESVYQKLMLEQSSYLQVAQTPGITHGVQRDTQFNGTQLQSWSQAVYSCLTFAQTIMRSISQYRHGYYPLIQTQQLVSPMMQLQQIERSGVQDLYVDLHKIQYQASTFTLSSTKLSQHHEAIDGYVSAMTGVISASAQFFQSEIQRAFHSVTATLNIEYNWNNVSHVTQPLSGALQNGYDFFLQLQSLLGQHTQHPGPTNIQETLKKLSELPPKVKQFDSELIAGKKNFDRLAEDITRPFDSLLQVIKTESDDSGRKGLKQYLNDELKAKYFKEPPFHSEKDNSSINKINADIGTQNDNIPKQTQSIGQAVKAIKTQLSSLKTSLKTDVLDKMSDLLNKGIFGDNEWQHGAKGVKKIHMEIKNIIGDSRKQEDTLTKILDDSDNFYQNVILKKAQAALDAINKEVIKQVQEKTKAIQNKAKTQYHTRINRMYDEMEQAVEKHIKEIEKKIAEDLSSGVKGFLRAVKYNDYPGNKLQALKDNDAVSLLASALHSYLNVIYHYLSADLPKHLPSSHYPSQLSTIHSAVDTLLSHLREQKHFTHEVPGMLAELKTSVQALHSTNFGNPAYPVLDAFPKSLVKFVEQLERGYVSTYSKQEWNAEYSGKYAQVCLTVFHTCFRNLNKLTNGYHSAKKSQQINLGTHLGKYLYKCGYIVSDDRKQNGELQNKPECTGGNIETWLTGTVTSLSGTRNLIQDLECLFTNVERYNRVCHHATFSATKYPSSIYQMLHWCSGLQYNSVYEKLCVYFRELFAKPKGLKEVKYSAIPKEQLKLEAYPHTIMYDDLEPALYDVCSRSRTVLTAILGHGHAGGVYASQFSNNSLSLYYPTSMTTLICMLQNIVYRLYQQLTFLYKQCCYPTNLSGWSDCWYGREVGGSDWQCNSLQCPNQIPNQKAKQNTNQTPNQSHKQTCARTCDQHPKCGLKSPLQSYLEDGLQGFLPHSVTAKSSGISCSTCGKTSPGMPCKTPMGFPEIGLTASQMKTGRDIRHVLFYFCGDSTACLTNLCGLFHCLLPSAPKTLGEMFAFYFNLLNGWEKSGEHRKEAFDSAVSNACFMRAYDEMNQCSDLFKHGKHFEVSAKQGTKYGIYHNRGDLYSLCRPNVSCYDGRNQCGAYIASLSTDTCGTFASKNASNYLSWIVYLTETFYDLLCQLSKACHGNCGSEKSRCRVTGCAKNICSFSKQSYFEETHMQHDGRCNSILNCRHTHPALYAYGFTFGDRTNLDGRIDDKDIPKRTCKTFIVQLQNVCSDRSVLSQIIHETIPNFLWKIRQPFSYLLLALWSLSLLYLLHIAVVRLDVLGIRSHLRSPSSHRIAAQSLLAAARVKALANVKYFSP